MRTRVVHVLGLFLAVAAPPMATVRAQCLDWMDGFGEDEWGANGYVRAILSGEPNAEQAVYLAGGFTQIGGIPASCIARWDGVTWSTLGEGLDNTVTSLCWFDDGSGLALYAAGYFLEAGGQPAERVARWRNGQWEDLDTRLNVSASALAVHRGVLYVGGAFTEVAGQPTGGLAAWDGEVWTAFPDSPAGEVEALASFDPGTGPQLIAAGAFPNFGGQGTAHIASMYDDGTWHALGVGPNGPCLALAVLPELSGPRLYVGGDFYNTGGQNTSNLAAWDGAEWFRIGGGPSNGGGVNDPVTALAVLAGDPFPTLGVVGTFSRANGGPNAGKFIEWTGVDWIAPESGITGWRPMAVGSVLLRGQRLVGVGGDFYEAGGKPSRDFAVYGVQCSKPVITEQPITQFAQLGDMIHFRIQVRGTRPIAYAWRKDGQALVDDGRIRGAATRALDIDPWEWSDGGEYDCVVTNDLGVTVSEPAMLVLPGDGLPVVPVEAVLTAPGPAPWDESFEVDYLHPAKHRSGGLVIWTQDAIGAESIVLWNGSDFREIMREGDPLPDGGPDEVFGDSDGATVREIASGSTDGAAFVANINGPGVDESNDRGLWTYAGGVLERAMREGDQVPGLDPGVVFADAGSSGVLPLWHAPDSSVLFTASATGGPFGQEYHEGLWVRDPAGDPRLLFLEGDTAPDNTASFVAFTHSLRADAGRSLTFAAVLDSSTGYKNYTTLDTGVWEGTPDGLRLVVQSGDWAPGFPEDVDFETFFGQNRTPIRSDAGLYWDSLVAGPIGFEASAAYHWDGSQIRPIAITGDRVPAGEGRTAIIDQPVPMGANNLGDVMMFSTGRWATRDGMWLVRPDGEWQNVAIVEDPLPPGSPEGLSIEAIEQAAVNDRRYAAFEAAVIPNEGINAVLGWSTNRGLFPILVPGSRVELGPGDIRVVVSAHLPTEQPHPLNGSSSAIDPLGRVLVAAVLADGTQAIFRGRFQTIRDAYFTCLADFNGDDIIDTRDFIAFLDAWASGEWAADLNDDDVMNTADVLEFLNLWQNGC